MKYKTVICRDAKFRVSTLGLFVETRNNVGDFQQINYPILWGGHLARLCIWALMLPTPQEVVEYFFIWKSLETRNFASLQQPVDESNKFGPLKSGSLQAIIHAYKSAVTRWCRKNGFEDFAWRSRFYDRIIRADGSLNTIREYIINNPPKWEHEKNNSANLWM
ncbi:MAG: hypothetical protein V7K32_16855 [Nostoc sp.]